MKINIFLNDYFIKYKQNYQPPQIHINKNLFKKIPTEGNLLILRGEPTIHPHLKEILYDLHKKDYILTTDAEKPEALFSYKGPIPYLSLNYDGFVNDTIRGNRSYISKNVIKTLDVFAGKKTVTRLCYTINPWNAEYFSIDVEILKHMMGKYTKMKKPYFLIYQQGYFFMQERFTWQPVDMNIIDTLNKASLLTYDNLKMLKAYHNKKEYSCVAPQDEVVITSDGLVRLCMSYRMNEVLGDLNTQSFEEIIESSKEVRNNCVMCNAKARCYLAHHYKENIRHI